MTGYYGGRLTCEAVDPAAVLPAGMVLYAHPASAAQCQQSEPVARVEVADTGAVTYCLMRAANKLPPGDYLLYAGCPPRAQVDADKRDAARLKYLIDSAAVVVSDPECAPGYWLEYHLRGGRVLVQLGEYETPRAAIDAAIAVRDGES